MIFLFSRVTGIQDEENVVETMCMNFIMAVFTISQDFIADLVEKQELNNES